MEWLAKPENLQNSDSLPPFIESFDAAPYLSAALPLAASVLALNLAHEAVQRAVAASKGVRALLALGVTCAACAAAAPHTLTSPFGGPPCVHYRSSWVLSTATQSYSLWS